MYRISQKDNFQKSNYDPKTGLKEQLINYIFNVIDLSRFKYELLQFDTELYQLVEKKYFLSANFSGFNCLLVFTKIRDTYHSCLIDRKTLSYNKNKVNVNDVVTFPVNIKLDRDIYNGTIFDGIFIQGKTKTFVITDVYFFKGQDYSLSKIDSKLLTIFSYLRSNYNENEKNNNLILTVNKLYPITEIETLTKVDIPKIKDFSVRGIAFYPEKSGTKLIYIYGNENKNNESNKNKPLQKLNIRYKSPEPAEKINIDEVKIKKTCKLFYCPKEKQDEDYVFQMKISDLPDVYMLNIIEPVKKDDRTLLKSIKVGIAFVPSASRSKWCKEVMANTNGNVLVNCKYNPEKMTWEPIRLSDAKKPSMISDFEIIEV